MNILGIGLVIFGSILTVTGTAMLGYIFWNPDSCFPFHDFQKWGEPMNGTFSQCVDPFTKEYKQMKSQVQIRYCKRCNKKDWRAV